MASAGFAFVELVFLFIAASGCILIKLQHTENGPYMDEVFHIPQVQNYCAGKFQEWDPMITTLPGLYLTTVGLVKPLTLAGLSDSVVCSVVWLRAVNILFATGNFYLLYLLMIRLHQHSKNFDIYKSLTTAFTLSLLPVLYFFSFLYYTDSGSTFCVLLMYLLKLHNSHKMAALVGAVAITFRQTNIIWLIFVAGLTAIEILMERISPEKKEKSTRETVFLQTMFITILNWIKKDRKSLFLFVFSVLKQIWSYLLVCMAFVAFVLKNGGIVVGAKDDHQAVLNIPQLYYFSMFSFGMSFMYCLSWQNIKGFFVFLWKKLLFVSLFCMVSVGIVYKLTYVHRYLLADNRHFTFYVWSKIYQRHELVKFIMIPVYLYAMWNLFKALSHKAILWKLWYCICVSALLVPSPLLEFRYFILPYLVYRLNSPISSYIRIVQELVFYVLINFATLYLFIGKPFLWENTAGYQRFMW